MLKRIWLISALVLLAIVSLIVAAPLTAESHFATSLYRGFAAFCHQLPERSYFIAGHKFAVCSRCTGLYAGFALTFLLYPLLRPLRSIDWPPPVWLVLSAVPMGIDVGLTLFGIWENTHTSRLFTGVLLGAVSVLYVMPGIAELTTRKTRQTGPTFTLSSPEHMASAPSDYSAPDRRI